MTIKSKKFNKKLARARRWSNFWFKLFKLRFMRKILKKILKQTMLKNNLDNVDRLQVFPSDFRKLSDEQIERGLNMFVERRELSSWSHIKEQNADGYLVVFPDENRSESRILNRIPEEINLNDVHIEPLQHKQQEKPAEKSKTNLSVDNQSEQTVESTNDDDDDEDYSKPF